MPMRRVLGLLAFVISTGAMAEGLPKLDANAGYLFPASNARSFLQQCSRSVPEHVTGTWLPTRAQILELEARLPAALWNVVSKRESPIFLWQHAPIGRQYGGLIVGDRKVIYVNAFPILRDKLSGDPFPSGDHSKKPVLMCDGGPNFFGVEFDPATNTFEDFEFNGAV